MQTRLSGRLNNDWTILISIETSHACSQHAACIYQYMLVPDADSSAVQQSRRTLMKAHRLAGGAHLRVAAVKRQQPSFPAMMNFDPSMLWCCPPSGRQLSACNTASGPRARKIKPDRAWPDPMYVRRGPVPVPIAGPMSPEYYPQQGVQAGPRSCSGGMCNAGPRLRGKT